MMLDTPEYIWFFAALLGGGGLTHAVHEVRNRFGGAVAVSENGVDRDDHKTLFFKIDGVAGDITAIKVLMEGFRIEQGHLVEDQRRLERRQERHEDKIGQVEKKVIAMIRESRGGD